MKRQVLECLDKRTLVELSKAVGFTGSQVLRKDEIVDKLVRKGSIGLTDLLAESKRLTNEVVMGIQRIQLVEREV